MGMANTWLASSFSKNRCLNLLILKITIAHFLRVCLSKTAQSQTKAPCRYPCTISSDSILNPQQKRESMAQGLAASLGKTLFSLEFSWLCHLILWLDSTLGFLLIPIWTFFIASNIIVEVI
jgi:hypothetical protein